MFFAPEKSTTVFPTFVDTCLVFKLVWMEFIFNSQFNNMTLTNEKVIPHETMFQLLAMSILQSPNVYKRCTYHPIKHQYI